MSMEPQHGSNREDTESELRKQEVIDMHSLEFPKGAVQERTAVADLSSLESPDVTLQEGFSAGEFQNCALPHQLLEGTPLGNSAKIRYKLKPLKDWTRSIDGNSVHAADLAAALGAMITAFPESDIAFEAAVILAKSSPTAGLLLINLAKQLDLFDEPSCFAIALATRVNEDWCQAMLTEIVRNDADPMIRCDALTVIGRQNPFLAGLLATDIATDIGPEASAIISTTLDKLSEEPDIPQDLSREYDKESQSTVDRISTTLKQTDETEVLCSALAGFLNSLPAHADVVFPLTADAHLPMEAVKSRIDVLKQSSTANALFSFQNVAEIFVNDNGCLEVGE